MIILSRLNKKALFLLLFSPIIAYIYALLGVSQLTFIELLNIIFFSYGVIYVLTKRHIRIPLFVWFVLFFALYRVVWNGLLYIEGDRTFQSFLFQSIRGLTIFFVLTLIYNTRFSEAFIKKSIVVIKITVIVAVIASIIQVLIPEFLSAGAFFRDDYELSHDLYRVRRSSIFGFVGPGTLGLSFIPLLSVLVGYLVYKRNNSYLLFLVMGGGVALLSNTRYIIVGFVLVTIQLLANKRLSLTGTIKYAVTIGLVLLLAWQILEYLGYDFFQWYDTRLLAEGSITGTTRYYAILNFLEFFPRAPIFGTGILTDEIRAASHAYGSSHIHVGYLSHLVYYGVIGCFFLFGYWFLLAKNLYQTAKKTNYWGSFFAFLVFLWSFATMSQPSVFYYGLLFAFVFDKYHRDIYESNNAKTV